MTELIFRKREIGRIMGMVREMALLDNKNDNARCESLSEAYEGCYDIMRQGDRGGAIRGVSEVLTVADFPYYFARVLSRAVYDRYQMQSGQWGDYTFPEMVPDWTVAERYQFTEFDRPVKTREKEETRPGWIAEGTVRQLQVEKYSKQIDFSNRILKNDDLGAFNDVTAKMASSTVRFTDWYVSALYDNATTQAALVALGANYSGTGRLTTANLMIAWNAFTQRVDVRNNPLAISAAYLVIPPILQLAANQILQSEKVAELAINGNNPIRNALQVKVDPYIGFTVPNVP